MKVQDRFIRYAKILTPSNEESTTVPTTKCQFQLAKLLAEEMREMGIQDVRVDENCYVYGMIPPTPGFEDKASLGFIAHMDTVSEFTDHPVQPIFHEDYDGEDLPLSRPPRPA